MNLYLIIWRCIIALLGLSLERGPLLPAGSKIFNGLGKLTVEPDPLFLLGSDLTVYCHIDKCPRRSSGFQISLTLNGETVNSWKRVNCTTTLFKLVNVRMPKSTVLCKQKMDQVSWIVSGLDLRGGLPPDKPENIICETSKSSDFINCSWERGQKTYVSTAYNISVNGGNGTQILFDQIQDAKDIAIPRAMIDENIKYQLIITAYNHFGASRSDPFVLPVKDIVIPEPPLIMLLEFGNNSKAAILHWKVTESSENLTSSVRLRTDNGSWEAVERIELKEGLTQVDGLKPLTEYEFQMQACNSTSGLTHTKTPRSASTRRSLCSKWSPSVKGRSPGKGPSQQLHVWRMSDGQGTSGLRMVTVLWKPPSPEDYSGDVQQYKIFLGNDHKQEVICCAAVRQCSVQVPAEVQALSISAVTSYGTSPPVDVPLRHSGDFGPLLRELAPAANGSAMFISWSWPGNKHWSTSGGELLHYVLEWTSGPVAELQWQELAKDKNNTSITGLSAGVRYNISLYAVTTRGVSAPSSSLVYSKEQKPESGPKLSVLVHEPRRIFIQWDELPVDQQRGFITNYTIYLQALDSSSTELKVTVPGSGPRRKWLNCSEGALALQLSASTSAGEGRRGNRITSQPAAPAVGLVIMTVFIITLFIAIITNLMCWSCVRERIKQKCISWGPAWFDENLLKPGNSIAIRLLEQDGSEVSLSPTYSDPLLSPISLISEDERDDVYPNVNVDISQVGQPPAETPLLMSDPGTMLEHVSYKPQIALLTPHGEEAMETEEEQMDVPTSEAGDRCSSVFGGLLGGFLSRVEVDFSDAPLGLTLSSVNGLWWPKTPETTSVLGTEDDVEVDSPSLDLQQGEIMTPERADSCLSQYTLETALTDGYFPQVATVSSTTICDAQK